MTADQPAAPRRIQRRRIKGWRKPAGAVIVDRTSIYGNPFRIVGLCVDSPDGRTWSCGSLAAAQRHATEQYRAWLEGSGPDVYGAASRTYDRRRILAGLPVLRGRDLACPCPEPAPGVPDWCHGAVLLGLVSGREVDQ